MTVIKADDRGIRWQLRHNHRLFLTGVILGLCAFDYGYDYLVVGQVLGMPSFTISFSHTLGPKGPVLTATDLSILSAVPISGAIFGALITGIISDRFGRKVSLYVGYGLGLLGSAIQTGGVNIAMFTIGRWIVNVSTFVLIAASVAFQNEVAPTQVRGHWGSFFIVAISLGGLISSAASLGTSKHLESLGWRIPIGLQCVWPLLFGVGILYLTESPTFYLIRDEDALALASLKKVRKGYSESEVEGELASLRLQHSLRASEEGISWTALFKGVNLRRTLLAGYVGNINTVTGIAYSTAYATVLLSQIGSPNPWAITLGLGFLYLAGSLVGLVIVDRMGRRTLCLLTAAILFIIDLLIGIMGCLDLMESDVTRTLVAFFLLFGFFYSAGIGPLLYINPAEFSTARLRNKTSAWVFFTQSCNALVCFFVFPYFTNPDAGNLGAKVFLIFAGCMFLHFVISFFVFPELKRRTPAEIDEMFAAKLPARKFKGYVCGLIPVTNVDLVMIDQKDEIQESRVETVQTTA